MIVTNHHVISDALHAKGRLEGRATGGGRPLDLVAVSVTLDPRRELPRGYTFPHLSFGDAAALRIGDRLTVVGFPTAGGLTNRPSVTVSDGIVSGFSGRYGIKTDALIMGGNSGGAALNSKGELIGVPTLTVDEGYGGLGHLGYLYTFEAMPDAWRKRIEGE
jgi:S1-C subfamily serine protease